MEFYTWDEMEKEVLSGTIARKIISGERAMVAQVFLALSPISVDVATVKEMWVSTDLNDDLILQRVRHEAFHGYFSLEWAADSQSRRSAGASPRWSGLRS